MLCPGQRKVGKPFQIFGGNLVQGTRSAKWETGEKWGDGKGGGKRVKNLVKSLQESQGRRQEMWIACGERVASGDEYLLSQCHGLMERNDLNSSAVLKGAHESALRVSGEGGQKGQS